MTERESLPAFYSDPQIRHLPQLLEEIDRGQIVIPRFQRPLVWPKEMRIALMESILESIPIGTIMLWRTQKTKISVKTKLGPFSLPKPDDKAPVRQYLLDGEQRLTTLYFALVGAPAARAFGDKEQEEEQDPAEFEVYYDLRLRRFITRDEIKSPLPHHLPLTALLQGATLVKFQRAILTQPQTAKTSSDPYDDADTLVDLSDEVADAFRQYKLPTVPVTSDEIDIVTRTFKRVNSQHVTMSEVHMVNSLAWSETFDFSDRLEKMKEGRLAELGWEDLDDLSILRVCKVALDKAVYEDNAEVVGEALKQNPGVLDDVEAHLCTAARFFRKYCSIRIPDLVPYSAQVVLLAAAFHDVPEPSQEVAHRMRDWLWFTTYTEMFQRQMSESRFSQLLNEVRALAGGLPIAPPRSAVRRPLPRFDFRHARARGVALLLAQQKPRDPHHPEKESTRVHASRLLAEHRTRGMAQIVTATMVDSATVSGSVGARVLIRPESLVRMRHILQSGEATAEFLASHVINEDAARAFQARDYAEFVKLREDALNRMEERRFQRIIERLHPGSPSPRHDEER